MSLVQLLSVGRSLLNIQDKPSPYRMREEHLLPKFGRVQETGKQRATEEAPPRETRKEPKVKDSEQVQVKRNGSLFRWVKRANPFARKPEAAAAPEKAPVQGELHLDSVRPVRNDLHETDVMVVPARAAESKEAATGREAEPAGAAGKTGSRIFGNK